MTGQDGKTLSEHFADGLKTFHGFSNHGFPNCFQMGGISQTGASVNLTSVLDDHILSGTSSKKCWMGALIMSANRKQKLDGLKQSKVAVNQAY